MPSKVTFWVLASCLTVEFVGVEDSLASINRNYNSNYVGLVLIDQRYSQPCYQRLLLVGATGICQVLGNIQPVPIINLFS